MYITFLGFSCYSTVASALLSYQIGESIIIYKLNCVYIRCVQYDQNCFNLKLNSKKCLSQWRVILYQEITTTLNILYCE